MLVSILLSSALVVEPYIDPAIQGAERDLMLEILAPYGQEFNGEVLYVDLEGTIHRNRLTTQCEQAVEVTGNPGQFNWPSYPSETFPLSTPIGYESGPPSPPTDETGGGSGIDPEPSSEVAAADPPTPQQGNGPPVYAGTGPYRRVYLSPKPILQARVDGGLASNLGMHAQGISGTGFVYMSPWSQTANFNSGGDFGLQFSHNRRVWDPFCLVAGRTYTSFRSIPPGTSFYMTMSAPRLIVSRARYVVDYYVKAYSGLTQSWDCIWIGDLPTNRNWTGTYFGVSKVVSIAQVTEGQNSARHEGTAWSNSTYNTTNSTGLAWNAVPTGFCLQRYPTALNPPRWTRMPVVTAGTSPVSESISIDCRP